MKGYVLSVLGWICLGADAHGLCKRNPKAGASSRAWARPEP
jgi:hypothetical protein